MKFIHKTSLILFLMLNIALVAAMVQLKGGDDPAVINQQNLRILEHERIEKEYIRTTPDKPPEKDQHIQIKPPANTNSNPNLNPNPDINTKPK